MYTSTSSKPSSFWSETVLKFSLNVLYLALTKGHNSEKEEAITIRLFIVHAQLHIKMNHSDKYAELLFNYYYLFFYLIFFFNNGRRISAHVSTDGWTEGMRHNMIPPYVLLRCKCHVTVSISISSLTVKWEHIYNTIQRMTTITF